MTSSQMRDVKLNPGTLAATVPLRRTGTEEVRRCPRVCVKVKLTVIRFQCLSTTQEMAGTILFLASRAGAYVNGAVWLVDGGRVGTVASSYSVP